MRTTTRIALLVIALIAGGLLYVRLAGGGDAVEVPAGARAGALTLKPCSYHGLPADCGTLVVPENRRNAGSRLIALPVTRVHASRDRGAEPIFRLEGGPGLTNMDFASVDRLVDDRDVVLVGYRGIDGTVRLDCPEVVDSMRHASDLLAPEALDARAVAYRSCARRLTASGIDLAGYTVPQRVEDLEAARRALGYGKVDLLSESAGTRTAMIYAWKYPAAIRRSVMIGANPPGNFVWDAKTTDDLIRRRCADCTLTIPDRWGPLRIKPGNVRAGSFFGLMEATSAGGPLNAPATLDAWREPSGMWLLSATADLAFPRAQVWGDVAAVARLDAAAARAHFADRPRSILGDAGSELVWGGGRLVDAWPANADDNAYATVHDSNVETLVISGELDGATPAVNATRELMPHLRRGQQVILRGFGHTGDFWNLQPAASAKLINGYLDGGHADASGFRVPKRDFTRDSTVAERIVGVLGGLALAMMVMLALLARGRRRSRPVVRSLGTVLLGLGGWSLGALIVWTALPSVPLDSPTLATLSIGVPIGLGCFLGWTGPRAAGLAAALAGALLGAWLGFSAASGLLAVVTTIAGAAAGANLLLIATDIATARPRSMKRFATP